MAKGKAEKDLLAELLKSDNLEAYLNEISFESGLKVLEDLVEKVEEGSLPLDQAVLSYERGAGLIEHLKSLLAGAEAKIKVLKK